MHFLASWKRALGVDLISYRSQYHIVCIFLPWIRLSNEGCILSIHCKIALFFLIPSLACPPFWKFVTESMRITWGQWLRTPGIEKNKCSSHCGKSLICFFWSWDQETVHEANSSIFLFKISLLVLHSHKTWPDLSPIFSFYMENLFFPAQFANILNLTVAS